MRSSNSKFFGYRQVSFFLEQTKKERVYIASTFCLKDLAIFFPKFWIFFSNKLFLKHRFGTFAIRDYPVHSLKMRSASHYLWQGSLEVDTKTFLLSTARSLFQKVWSPLVLTCSVSKLVLKWYFMIYILCCMCFQMIFAHRKSFEAEKFDKIKALFQSATQEIITVIILLMAHLNVFCRQDSSIICSLPHFNIFFHSCYSMTEKLNIIYLI